MVLASMTGSSGSGGAAGIVERTAVSNGDASGMGRQPAMADEEMARLLADLVIGPEMNALWSNGGGGGMLLVTSISTVSAALVMLIMEANDAIEAGASLVLGASTVAVS